MSARDERNDVIRRVPVTAPHHTPEPSVVYGGGDE